MKNIVLFISCFLLSQTNYSQSVSGFHKKADSLYKTKDYKNAAIARSNALRLEGNAVRMGMYWNCACLWSMAEIPDSAFYYLGFIEKSNKATLSMAKQIESDEDLNAIKSDKRWQSTIEAITKRAISQMKTLSQDVKAGKRINPSVDRFEIALAWASIQQTDSALFYLASIINSDNNRYVDPNNYLGSLKAFEFLYQDPRWIALIDNVKKNSPSLTCDHRPRGERIPMVVTIDPASKFLKADGKGSYRNSEDKVSSYIFTAYNFLLSGVLTVQESGNWADASPRYFTIDLDKPIKKSGAQKQGIITDHFATFHAFYKIDTTAKLDLIYNLNEMPIGATIESPRTEINFFMNRKLHTLKFGSWSLGECGEPYACGGKINGIGTTAVKITRHTNTSYTIEAATGSVGRLWDIDNRSKPVDMGLFESGFIIHVKNQ